MTNLPIIFYPDEDTGFFKNLTTKEAKYFFNEFVSLIPERVNRFTQLIRESMDTPDWSIDDNAEQNIQLLYEWLSKNVEKRILTPDELYEEKMSVHPHLSDWISDWKFSGNTISNIVYVGIVWGELIRLNAQNCQWKIINNRGKLDADYNQPCLQSIVNKDIAMNPIRIIRVLAREIIEVGLISTDEIIQLYRQRITAFNSA